MQPVERPLGPVPLELIRDIDEVLQIHLNTTQFAIIFSINILPLRVGQFASVSPHNHVRGVELVDRLSRYVEILCEFFRF